MENDERYSMWSNEGTDLDRWDDEMTVRDLISEAELREMSYEEVVAEIVWLMGAVRAECG